MICLADNDYILKLAACDLLMETFALFGAASNEIYVLPSAKYKFRKNKRNELSQKYGEGGLARAVAFVESVGIIIEIENEETALMREVRDPQTGREQIDAGERILLASIHAENDFLLLTGDKRCLRALASAPTCAAVHARHCGRVVCVEQTLLWLIEAVGFSGLLQKVVPARDCDTSLRAAFGSGYAATQENVTETLARYVNELDQETAGLLKQTL